MRILCFALGVTLGLVAAGTATASEEDRLRSETLYKLAHFVSWPDDGLGHRSQAIRICVSGAREFEAVLAQTIGRRRAQDRPLRVDGIGASDSTEGCHIVYFGLPGGSGDRKVIESLGEHPVLTIGEDDDFVERGGMVALTWNGDKVGLAINRAATERSGLRISSQVLRLAKLVAEEVE